MLEQEQLLRDYLKEKRGMSDTNIDYFLSEFEKCTEKEKSELIYEAVGKEIYKMNPVDIVTFIEDPYFLGSVYDNIFKIWKEVAQEIYPAPFCKKYDQVVLSCATRCFGKGTEIRMFNGHVKKVENVKAGDKVMGDDGTPRTVLSIARGKEQMYKITPFGDEDCTVLCNASHKLPLFSFMDNYEVKEVGELFKEREKGRRINLSLPDCNYLKKVTKTGTEYKPFKIDRLGVNNYYGFELDGNHLFRLGNGYIHHNSGKTYFSTLVLMYELYLLLCMINPIKSFSVSNIVFAFLSKDNSTAVSQIGGEIFKCLTQSPYFSGVVKDKLSFSKLDKDGVRITDDILFKAGSSISTIIGTNLYAACLDEANAKPANVAAENLITNRIKLYQEMRDRRFSSFSKAPKRSGMLLFTSSPTDEGDVLSEIIEDVKKEGIEGVLIRDNIPRWVAREEDMEETFDFFLGSDTKDPCIVDETIVLKDEEWDRVIQVPNRSEYYQQFSSDPYLAIQNIAGRRTMPEMALFSSVAVFEKVFYKNNYIFKTDTPSISVESFRTLDDFMCDDNKDYFSHPDHPDCFRYIHLDMAYRSDRFGMSSVYSDLVKYTSEDGHEIYRRKYFVDFCLGIQAKNKETVDILKVLEFVYSLKERGYPLKLVTTDNHQGEIARQMISKRGVRTEYLSVEKSKEQYLNLKNIIITEALEGFINPPLMRELRGLRESQKKIEKGKGYTDDMSDSLAGALWSCSQDRFYKKNNEAISEIIRHTGNSALPIIRSNSGFSSVGRGFSGMAKQINRNNSSKGMGLGFNYNRFN